MPPDIGQIPSSVLKNKKVAADIPEEILKEIFGSIKLSPLQE